jgi:DNA-directed RNA polymerase sigma subunit (sigma70/sigma32)
MKRISIARSGDWSALDAYLNDVSRLPVMTDEESAAAGVRACKGDVDAQEQLVKSHLRLVVRIAHHYAGFGLPLADLIAEGNLALMRAAELYNPKFGTKFTTYASVWVKQRIHRAITKQGPRRPYPGLAFAAPAQACPSKRSAQCRTRAGRHGRRTRRATGSEFRSNG